MHSQSTAARTPGGLRSVLFAPGNHERRVSKALESAADAVVLDLEDAVPPAEKARARAIIKAALSGPSRCKVYVRVNADCWNADLEGIAGARLDGIVLPKVESPEQILRVDKPIATLEPQGVAGHSVDVMPLIETARGILSAIEIASCSPRVRCLAFGGADYTFDLDLQWSVDEHELAYARATLTHASRAAGIEPPIDSVVVQVKDTDRLRSSARTARRMGFQGKLCIHPDQVVHCNEIFTPSAAEIEHARAVLAAFAQAEAGGSAAIQLDGALIDYAIVRRAQRVLAVAERLAST